MLADVPAVAVDGRMLPHEWLRTPHGILKTDAVDHHDDHFFPGPQDIAWDVAGFVSEFGLAEKAARGFTGEVAALSGDRSLRARLPFYRIAYLAYRVGYASMAARTLGPSRDGTRMAALVRRYRQQLRLAIAGLGDPHFARVGARRSRRCSTSSSRMFCRYEPVSGKAPAEPGVSASDDAPTWNGAVPRLPWPPRLDR
jgi:hypothetical protein